MTGRWIVAALLLVTALAGCLDPDGPETPGTPGTHEDAPYNGALDDSHDGMPSGFLPDAVTGLEHVTNPVSNGTYAVWANDDLLYVASGAGLRIMDISDPNAPVVLSEDILDTQSRDVDLLFHPDGRLYAVLADGGQTGVRLIDVTDPTDPEFVSISDKCTHNISVLPGTTLVYSSYSLCHTEALQGGDLSDLTIVDFADPQNPVDHHIEFPSVAMTVGGVPRPVDATSCHDVTFQVDRELAYCAGITQTLIMDISDPLAPEIIQVIDWPGINIHHAVWPAHGGDLLILGDEVAGVLAPVPACSKDVAIPTSALWFFDTSDLSMPTPLGYFQAEHYDAVNADVLGSIDPTDPFTVVDASDSLYCSTHFGSLVEDRDLFVLGWYHAGTVLLDFSDPTAPFQVGEFRADGPSDVTDATYYKGHVYSTDGQRGIDVLRII